ncbi:MAG: exodeoxyribonuclease VII large subunit [Candidatus Omnitrophota bacterium]|nr:MAG: exodeoxyribonuclease VII large subunit [Candidatus Omnitrophota bacterium]
MTQENFKLFIPELKTSPINKQVYTVSQVTEEMKLLLENNFSNIWVEGEVSNFKVAPSGHAYFSLKDERALLAAVMFKRANRDIKFKLEDGLKVICLGSINVYPARGQHQLIVEKIEPKGIGARQLAFEQLKKKLFKEGLFDPAHKKPLPLIPLRLGIITSRRGAAIRDILGILKKGAPFVDVIVRSVNVQGELAARQIAQAIRDFEQFKEIDLLIICRGGGSSEDLWSFNEEIVARAIYNCPLPVLSAVGHQINITLSDLVADMFVETPTAAAKIIVDKKNNILTELEGQRNNLEKEIRDVVYELKSRILELKHLLKSPMERLLEKEQILDDLADSLLLHYRHYLDATGQNLRTQVARLEALSPLAILSRGYSLSMLMPGASIIKESKEIKKGDLIKTVLAKGALLSSVQEVFNDKR